MIAVGDEMGTLGEQQVFQGGNMAQLCGYFKMFYARCLFSYGPAAGPG